MPVSQLAYVVFDIEKALMPSMKDIFEQVFEAPTLSEENGSVKVRLDGRDFRILLQPAEQSKLAAVGWQVENKDELKALLSRLSGAGISASYGDQELASERSAEKMIRFTDPEGFPVEVIVDKPFSDAGSAKDSFMCGKEDIGSFGFGHLVQANKDLKGAIRFYQNVMGMGYADEIDWQPMGADLHFLYCNQRHHSLALVNEAFGLKGGMIDHIMLQAKNKEQVQRAYAKLDDLDVTLSQTLGQHTNDQVTSFYLKTPAGFRVEFGYGGLVIGDPAKWEQKVFDVPSSWGHEPVH